MPILTPPSTYQKGSFSVISKNKMKSEGHFALGNGPWVLAITSFFSFQKYIFPFVVRKRVHPLTGNGKPLLPHIFPIQISTFHYKIKKPSTSKNLFESKKSKKNIKAIVIPSDIHHFSK